MSALEEVERALANVVGKLDTATAQIDDALERWEESRTALGQALEGAHDPDALEALGLQQTAADELTEARRKVTATRARVVAYRLSIGGNQSSGSTSPEPERPAAPKRSPNAVGVDGSEYPSSAAWAVPELPPRVQERGDRTVGKVKIGDQTLPGEFRSGQRDVWSDEAAQRIKELGIRVPAYLAFHVEARAAAMMIRSGVTSGEVVINNVPCGYQTRPPGCHQLLEPFLPEGSQVTVSGTDRKGRPYRRTYNGKATR